MCTSVLLLIVKVYPYRQGREKGGVGEGQPKVDTYDQRARRVEICQKYGDTLCRWSHMRTTKKTINNKFKVTATGLETTTT